jgi:hypothetical protein
LDPKDGWEIQDEIEQLHQIEAAQKFQEDEQQQRNHEQLFQLQQWDHIIIFLQQLNQNYYDVDVQEVFVT